MFSANEVQALLLGSGGFLAPVWQGWGLPAVFCGDSWRVTGSDEPRKGADSLERVVARSSPECGFRPGDGVEGTADDTRDDILKMGTEREQIGRDCA